MTLLVAYLDRPYLTVHGDLVPQHSVQIVGPVDIVVVVEQSYVSILNISMSPGLFQTIVGKQTGEPLLLQPLPPHVEEVVLVLARSEVLFLRVVVMLHGCPRRPSDHYLVRHEGREVVNGSPQGRSFTAFATNARSVQRSP